MGTLRFAHARRRWPFSGWTNQGEAVAWEHERRMKVVDLQHGVASSIGSLPHTDPRAAATFVLERQPAPAGRAVAAEPLRHGADGRPGRVGHRRRAACSPTARSTLDDPMLDPRAPLTTAGIDGEPFVGLRAFLGAVAGRRAPIKLQLTGPVTLGIALLNLGVPAAGAFAVAGLGRARPGAHARRRRAGDGADGAARRVRRRARPHRRHAPRLPARAEPHHRPRVERAGHHRAARRHRPALLRPGRLARRAAGRPQILSLPLDAGAVEHAGALGAFLERGGRVAWGAVPTAGPLGSTPERLWQHLSAEWCALTQGGCDPVLLREQALDHPGLRARPARRGPGRPRAPPHQPGRPPPRDADPRHAPHRRRLARRSGAVTPRRYDRRSCRPIAPSPPPGRGTTR